MTGGGTGEGRPTGSSMRPWPASRAATGPRSAVAGGLGVRKQTILYYFASKDALLEAVIHRAAADLAAALVAATEGTPPDRIVRVQTVIDTVFRVGARRPELLALLREASRLGPPASTRLTDALEPMVSAAAAFLAESGNGTGADDGLSPTAARKLVLRAGARIIGLATEVEVLAGLGLEADIGWVRRRRRELLTELRHDHGAAR
ncbi:MAG: TetR/AcrR family transcriptional regulator [Acidimicrobiales bacterium]